MSKFVCLSRKPWLPLLCPAVLIVHVCAGPWEKTGEQCRLNTHVKKGGREGKPVGFRIFLPWFGGGNGDSEAGRTLGLRTLQ